GFIDGAVTARMKAEHIAGVTVSVVQNGQVVFKRGYGVADAKGTPVDPDRTLFRIGSLSKAFTWIAVAKTAEDGRIRLDAPANTYLPPKLRFADQGFSQPITINNLMSHSAGLEDIALGHLLVLDPKTLRSLPDYLAQERPNRVRAPGRPSYSNFGAITAGWIAANAAGVDFPTLTEQRIFQPLAMQWTTFREPYPARAGLPAPADPSLAANISSGFKWSGGEYKPLAFEYISHNGPAGSASSTAADMSKVMRLLLSDGAIDGVRIYSPQTARLLRTPLIQTPEGMNGWAHGLMTGAASGYRTFGHDGDTNAFHTSLVTVPDLDLGVFVSTNTEGGEKLATALPGLVVEHFYAPKMIGGAFRKPGQGELAAYAGNWIGTRRAFTGLEKFIGLMNGPSVTATKTGLVISTSSTKLYLPTTEPGVFRTADRSGVVSFDLENGKPVRWRTGGNNQQQERMKPWEQPTPLLVLAGLALLGAVATIVGVFTRHRPYAQKPIQALASRSQTAAAAGWLIAAGALALWLPASNDVVKLVVEWPQPAILVFSWAALAAALISVADLGLLVPAWSSRGEGSWSLWRKLRYSMTAVIFVLLAVELGLRGALQPWTV
ncbi:MAG: serine hydrolase domain-containing protein, partial [Caulobacteraceae bacterium]